MLNSQYPKADHENMVCEREKMSLNCNYHYEGFVEDHLKY